MEHISFVNIIRKAFDEKATRTLNELFSIVQANANYSQFESAQIKHKIRRCIFSLKENNEIKKIGTSIYKKI